MLSSSRVVASRSISYPLRIAEHNSRHPVVRHNSLLPPVALLHDGITLGRSQQMCARKAHIMTSLEFAELIYPILVAANDCSIVDACVEPPSEPLDESASVESIVRPAPVVFNLALSPAGPPRVVKIPRAVVSASASSVQPEAKPAVTESHTSIASEPVAAPAAPAKTVKKASRRVTTPVEPPVEAPMLAQPASAPPARGKAKKAAAAKKTLVGAVDVLVAKPAAASSISAQSHTSAAAAPDAAPRESSPQAATTPATAADPVAWNMYSLSHRDASTAKLASAAVRRRFTASSVYHVPASPGSAGAHAQLLDAVTALRGSEQLRTGVFIALEAAAPVVDGGVALQVGGKVQLVPVQVAGCPKNDADAAAAWVEQLQQHMRANGVKDVSVSAFCFVVPCQSSVPALKLAMPVAKVDKCPYVFLRLDVDADADDNSTAQAIKTAVKNKFTA